MTYFITIESIQMKFYVYYDTQIWLPLLPSFSSNLCGLEQASSRHIGPVEALSR